MAYKIVRSISQLLRFCLCYATIEQLPLFANEGATWLFGQIISIYTIFRLICYPTVGVLSRKWGIENPIARSIMYFIMYLPLIGIYWVVLRLLTWIGILPIYA